MRRVLLVVLVFIGFYLQSQSAFVFAYASDEGWPPDCTQSISRFFQVNSELYRGGQPQTVQDLECLKTVGIKTVISLIIEDPKRIAWERELVSVLGMEFYSFPMTGILPPSDHQVSRIFKTLLDSNQFPIYIHCMQGKDRTGLIIGLYRVWVDGWAPQAAWEEMRSIGFDPKFVGLTSYFWHHSKKPMPMSPH